MSIFKVAKMFQQKIVNASAGNFNHLKSVYNAAMAVVRLKPLWLTSAKDDLYEEAALEQKIDKIKSLATKAWSQVMAQGMPFAGANGFTGFMNSMEAAASALSDATPRTHLDPQATNSVSKLQNAIYFARTQASPVGIPAQNVTVMPEMVIKEHKPQVMPEMVITEPKPKPAGAAYLETEDEGEENMSYMPLPYLD